MQLELIVSLLALATVVLTAYCWPNRRRQMLFGALFSLPILALELVAAGTFARLGVTAGEALLYLTLTGIAVMAVGAVAAVVADVTLNRWLSPTVHVRRHILAWLAVGLGLAVGLHLVGVALGLALVIGLLVNALLILVLDRELLWDALVGASAFALWFALADTAFGIRASGDIHGLLIGPSPIGLTLNGLPFERVLIALMAGALLGPLFTATKKLRSVDLPQTADVSRAKMGLGLIVTTVGFLALCGIAYAFVLPPAAQAMQPASGTTVATAATSLTVSFTRPIDRDTVTLTVNPPVDGTWVFGQPSFSDHGFRQAQFVFASPLSPGTTYRGTITSIESVWGIASPDVPFQFTTAAAPVPVAPIPAPTPPVVTPPTNTNAPTATNTTPTTPTPPAVPPAAAPVPVSTPQHVLSIRQDYQDSPLSCEAAALKMALAGVGVKVTETQIMDVVGYDPTPHVGDVWGDPNIAFVGNIAGKQDTTGYGVYWGPVARAANHWHSAKAITNGTPEQVAAAIWAGHPVIVWGTYGHANRDSWKTPAGVTVAAWKGEHARTVVGVIGTADHPVSFILNDPVAGRITWSRSTLDANWSAFNHSGVILE